MGVEIKERGRVDLKDGVGSGLTHYEYVALLKWKSNLL